MRGLIFSFCSLTMLIGLAAGCSDSGPTTFKIAGTVTYANSPVPAGTIQFIPDDTQGNSGPALSLAIKDGKYDSGPQEIGTIGGPHIVVIQGFDGNAKPQDELPNGMPLFVDFRMTANLPKADTVDQNFTVQFNRD